MSTVTERPQPTDDLGTVAILRRGLLGLAGLTIAGIALELAIERHWTKPSQLIAWAALVALAAAVGLLVRAGQSWRVRAAQALAVVVMLSALLGIWEHVEGNHNAGPLDANYAQTWDGLAPSSQWWLALSKGVGPAPSFAPGALAIAGLLVLLATARHPALRGRGRRGR